MDENQFDQPIPKNADPPEGKVDYLKMSIEDAAFDKALSALLDVYAKWGRPLELSRGEIVYLLLERGLPKYFEPKPRSGEIWVQLFTWCDRRGHRLTKKSTPEGLVFRIDFGGAL